MSERYLVTGVQLAMLTETENKEERKKLVDEIVDKQFITNSEFNILTDVETVTRMWV